MSIESAKAFYQRVTTDEAFRTQVESYPIEERGTFLQAEGYAFTEEEWETTSAEMLEANSTEELDEAELEAIAGGIQKSCYPGPVALYGIFPIPYDTI
ncbi:Nif11-like leader peptide family natural product precursor [Nostoc sp. C117]|uniref:Nif11-like leader peptide family natural product precursor n=1 Tax=Nostoc sp. C117 TaxID=3349875 RepID=UPI00370D1353